MAPPKSILVQTGNILQNEHLVRKVDQTTQEEVKESVETTLNSWHDKPSEKCIDKGDQLVVSLPSYEPHQESGSIGLKTTIKIFLASPNDRSAIFAVKSVLKELQQPSVDCVILKPLYLSEPCLLPLKNVWKQMESLVDEGLAQNIGIADICSKLFMELFNWARIKPSVIQLNVAYCCTVSEELNEFTESNEIQILTHSDDTDINVKDITNQITNNLNLSEKNYELDWLARHRSIQTYYGVMIHKGYSLGLSLIE